MWNDRLGAQCSFLSLKSAGVLLLCEQRKNSLRPGEAGISPGEPALSAGGRPASGWMSHVVATGFYFLGFLCEKQVLGVEGCI